MEFKYCTYSEMTWFYREKSQEFPFQNYLLISQLSKVIKLNTHTHTNTAAANNQKRKLRKKKQNKFNTCFK